MRHRIKLEQSPTNKNYCHCQKAQNKNILFLLFIFRLIVLKTSGYIVASVMSQNEKEEIPFGISSFSSYKKD